MLPCGRDASPTHARTPSPVKSLLGTGQPFVSSVLSHRALFHIRQGLLEPPEWHQGLLWFPCCTVHTVLKRAGRCREAGSHLPNDGNSRRVLPCHGQAVTEPVSENVTWAGSSEFSSKGRRGKRHTPGIWKESSGEADYTSPVCSFWPKGTEVDPHPRRGLDVRRTFLALMNYSYEVNI